MKLLLALSVVLPAMSGCAAVSLPPDASVSPGSRGVTTLPSIASLPTSDFVSAYHPRAHGGAAVAGQAELECVADVDQRVRDCRVLSEFPEAQGFGASAQALSRWVLIAPGAVDGVPTKGLIRFRLSFPAPE